MAFSKRLREGTIDSKSVLLLLLRLFCLALLNKKYKRKRKKERNRRRQALSFGDAAVVGPASRCRRGARFPTSAFRTSGTGRSVPRLPAKESSQRRLPHARLRRRKRERERWQRRLFRVVVVVVDASRKLCLIFPFVLPFASAPCDPGSADRPAPGLHLSNRGDGRGPSGRLCVSALGHRSVL